MPAPLSHQITAYIVAAASAPIETLAQQTFDLAQEYVNATDDAVSERLHNLRNVVDAIGAARFGESWPATRDGVGFNQDAA